MKLIIPNNKYKNSFFKAFFSASKKDRISLTAFFDARLTENKFAEYIELLKNHRLGTNIYIEKVPQTVYWLVDNNKFIGRVTIRHKLNKRIIRSQGHIGYIIAKSERNKGYGTQALKLALQKAKELKLKRVLITCKENNLASKKIIEKNGGKFKNAIYAKADDKFKTLRYWIDLK